MRTSVGSTEKEGQDRTSKIYLASAIIAPLERSVTARKRELTELRAETRREVDTEVQSRARIIT